MWMRIELTSATPVFQQVVDGVKAAVAKGVLRPGDKLASVRELAMLLTLNHNTVAKAYQELERERVIEVLRGRGTFVANVTAQADPARLEALRLAMRHVAIDAHYLQLSDEQLVSYFQAVVRSWRLEQEMSAHAASVADEKEDS